MAKELSQEEVLDFLCQGGGKVPNASLLGHFRHLLRDPRAPAEQLLKRRERFKRYVNSVAVVKQEGAVKYVVLRSRYRDLLGEDLRPPAPGEVARRQEEPVLDDQTVPGALHGAQVGGGWSSQAGVPQVQGDGYGQQPQQGVVVASNAPFGPGDVSGPWDAPSYIDRELQQPSSRLTSPSSNTAMPTNSTSSCLTSSPSSNTSSPENNTSLPNRNTSKLPNKTCPPASNAPSPPSTTSIPSTKGSSPPNSSSSPFNKTPSPTTHLSSLPSNTSSPENNTSLPNRNTSEPSSKTCPPASNVSSPLCNTLIPSTKRSSPPSSNSSPLNKTSSPKTNLSSPYYNRSFSGESLAIPEDPSLASSWHQPGEETRTEPANPAFVNPTCMDLEGHKEGCFAWTEPQSPNFHLDGSFPQEVHEEHCTYMQEEQQMHGFSQELPASPPSSRYLSTTYPSPSLLFPLESSIAPPDVLLADYQPTSRSPSPPLHLNDMHGMWMCQMPVFKSIRCQLSLQDMEDFVDQESCGSEGTDSGEGGDCDTEHRDEEDPSSDSNNEEFVHYMEQKCESTWRCPPNKKFLRIIEQYNKLSEDPAGVTDTLVECGIEPNVTIETWKSPYTTKSFLTDQAPILFELAVNPPRHRMSSRLQAIMSSSDDELIGRDYRKRRRPSRTKKPPNIILVPPQPDVDLLLTAKPVSAKHFIANNNIADQKSLHVHYVPNVNMYSALKTFNYKTSTVPLDAMEHDWIVKSASGSWLQVYGLFNEDPQLALRKDFISGYTALHWFAKHGSIDMFHKLVGGAKKAGIELDLNIKSNGGYTPLHIAAIHGHHKVAAMLVEKLKVNVKLRDNSGKRAWQYLSCNTSGEVWQLLGAPKGKTIFAARALNTAHNLNMQNKSSQINRKASLAAFLKPQHQKWKANHHPALREREIYSD